MIPLYKEILDCGKESVNYSNFEIIKRVCLFLSKEIDRQDVIIGELKKRIEDLESS